MRRVLSILYLLIAVSAFAQNTIPSSFAPMGRIGMSGFPAWDAVPYSFEKFLPTLNRFVGAASTDTATTFGNLSGSSKWVGGVLAPNGCVYGIPYSSTSVLKIDPTTDTVTTFGALSGGSKWAGGVLAPNGCIYGIPYDSPSILKIDPTTDTATTFGNLSGGSKWFGGVLAPNGCIYGIPRDSTSILKIDVGIPESLPLNALLSAFLNKL